MLLISVAHVRQDEAPVVVGREAADPAVEQLHGLRSGCDLRVEVAGDRAGQAAHQRVPRLRRLVHQRLGVHVVARAAAFDDVRRQRERRAGKADRAAPSTRRGLCVRRRRRMGPPRPRRHRAGVRRRPACARGLCSTGPSPLENSRPTPIGSTISRMSAKMIAASTPRRSTAVTVTSAAASASLQSSRKPCCERTARYSGM